MSPHLSLFLPHVLDVDVMAGALTAILNPVVSPEDGRPSLRIMENKDGSLDYHCEVTVVDPGAYLSGIHHVKEE